jgi:hypothetical protein
MPLVLIQRFPEDIGCFTFLQSHFPKVYTI